MRPRTAQMCPFHNGRDARDRIHDNQSSAPNDLGGRGGGCVFPPKNRTVYAIM